MTWRRICSNEFFKLLIDLSIMSSTMLAFVPIDNTSFFPFYLEALNHWISLLLTAIKLCVCWFSQLCEYKRVSLESWRKFSYQWVEEKSSSRKGTQALKNYPIIWTTHHKTYWNSLNSSLYAPVCSFRLNSKLSKEIFHKIFLPRPCFEVDKMSRAMKISAGAWKNFNFLREKHKFFTKNTVIVSGQRLAPKLYPF